MIQNKAEEIQNYFSQKKELQNAFLSFIDGDQEDDDYFNLQILIKEQKILERANEAKEFLHLIKNVVDNHHRKTDFLNKIEKFLNYLKNDITKIFENKVIFEIIFDSRATLHLFFKIEILTVEESFKKILIDPGDENVPRLCHYFYEEMKPLIDEEKNSQIKKEILNFNVYSFDNYNKKRLIGENDSYICSLIRNDLVEEFIAYVNKYNFQLTRKIDHSIFETNSFLIGKNPTLIEYAAFYGSIQIFKYLLKYLSEYLFDPNNVRATENFWIYAVHSTNGELIHLLEYNKIMPKDESFEECFYESIKCHNNDVADYILCNKLNANKEYKEKTIEICLKYNNYYFLPNSFKDIDENNGFVYLCKYNYIDIVELFMDIKLQEIKNKINIITFYKFS